ncbi:MAG: BMP family ABC transporter substrate-binding protein [Gammaproteobacteria bacterium]|nr:BMP family ABC transporter substrate-binding protein [Gammaproteobacteria bacterium]
MLKRFSRKAAVLFTAAFIPLLLASAVYAEDPVKVGFVYVGPVGDHGWTYRHDVARQSLEKELSDKVSTTYVESVAEGADAERVIRKLASSHDLVFTTSFGYMNPTVKVAKQFPDVKFEHATGYKQTENVATYSGRFYEGRAVIGTIAGLMTKSNVVGYIASFPIPEVVRGINAFSIAMRKVNPQAQLKIIWVNSWYDPGKEGDAAKALIDQGADILTQHTDSAAPLQVAEQRGVHGFGQASDMSKFAPKAQLTAIVDEWSPYYIQKTKGVIDGSWTSGDTWSGIKDGMVVLAPYGEDVPADVREAADKVKASIVDGSWHPFQGPIKNQAGEEVVAEGAVMSDEDLLKMDWYVEGVQGSLPK